MNNSKVLISGKRIDVIDHIMDEYLEYLRIATDQESGYEYRHLFAWGLGIPISQNSLSIRLRLHHLISY